MNTVASPYDHLPYRAGVGIMLLNSEHHVFVAQRLDMRSDAWQMPQGGIDDGETPLEAAYRELEEEIGTAKADVLAKSTNWYHYDLPDTLVPNVWNGAYRGQKQQWFVMRFTGAENDISLETEIPEFSTYQWVKPTQLPGLIVPFKRKLYEALLEEFTELL